MRKKFLTNVSILLGLNLLIKPFWILGIDRTIQNTVGNAEYGVYANLFAFSVLFVMLLDFGINNLSSSSIAKDHSIVDDQFSSLVPLKLFFSLVYICITVLAGFIYGFRNRELFILFVMSFNQVLAYLILYFRSIVSGLQHFRTDAVLSVIDRALMITVCSLLIWASFTNVTIEIFTLGQTIGYVVSAFICFIVLRGHIHHLHLSFDRQMLMMLVRKAYPYALLALLITLYTRLDMILIKKLHSGSDTENGIYAQATRLLEASNMLAAMVASMLLSLFSKILTDKAALGIMVRTIVSVMLAPAMMLSLFCAAYKLEIMHLLYTNSGEYHSEVFSIVILSFVPLCMMYIFGTLLTANGNLRLLNITAAIALVINFTSNIFLIPVYGAKGAAITAVITQSTFAFFNVYYSAKKFELNLGITTVIQYVVFSAIFFTLVHFIEMAGTGLITGAVISCAAGISLMFILRIVNYQSVIRLVHRH